jgi:hypothetical protein
VTLQLYTAYESDFPSSEVRGGPRKTLGTTYLCACSSGDRAALYYGFYSNRQELLGDRKATTKEVCLEGFEPPTPGLGNRAGSFILVLSCSKMRLSKRNSHVWGCSSFTVVSGGLVY